MNTGHISWFDHKSQEGMIRGNGRLYYFSAVAVAHGDYSDEHKESYTDNQPVQFNVIDNVAYNLKTIGE